MNSLQNGRCFFCVQPPLKSPPKSFPLLESTFISLFHPYFLTTSSLQSLPTLSSSELHQFFISLFLHTTIPASCTEKIFLTSAIQPLQATSKNKKLWSLVRNGTVLISVFFLKVLEVITRLTINDSLSLRLKKSAYCRQQPLMKIFAIRMAKHPIHFFLIPPPYCHFSHTLLIPSEELTFLNLLKLIFIISLTISCNIDASLSSSLLEITPS